MMREEHSGSSAKGEQSELMSARETLRTQNAQAVVTSISQQRSAYPAALPDSPYSVELHIDELVLHGFAPNDRHSIGDALERELTRLFAERGAPAIRQGGEFAHLDVGEFEVSERSNPEMMGSQLGKIIHREISQ